MAHERTRSALPYLGAVVLAALAIVVWLWPQSREPAVPSAAPRTTSSGPSVEHQPSPNSGAVGEADGSQAVRERGHWTIALLVQDLNGRAIAGAEALLGGTTEVLATSDETGALSLGLPRASVGDLVVRADEFVPTLVALTGLVEGTVVRLRPMPGSTAVLRVVDASAGGIPGVRVSLTASDGPSTRPASSAETDSGGLALLGGLEPGNYAVSLHLGPFDVSGFARPQDAQIGVPGPETTTVLSLPNIAWAKPRTGRVVVGFFRVPVGASDFGRTHSILRGIEERCRSFAPGSLARAFMGSVDEVDLVALVDPGGWTTARVPTLGMTAEMTPTLLPNPGPEPVPFGRLTVHARSVNDEPIHDAPFALSLVSANHHGSITFPIEFGVSQRLPAGRYTFVALQAGASRLFRGPRDAVSIEEDGDLSVSVQATRPIRRVTVAVEQWTRDGERLNTLGVVRISDGVGFSTGSRPATEPTAWLPTGQALTATTRLRVGLRYADLDGDFFVSDTGKDPTVIRLQERP